jgi:hypothetical protein
MVSFVEQTLVNTLFEREGVEKNESVRYLLNMKSIIKD